ncbi:MAG: DUF58 domain-containing protein [Chryseolinea sp.]
MKTQLSDLLKPEVLHTVTGLELVARIVVEGFMSGSNRSQSIGAGQEFSQYRSYEPGDDLRQLDWKMYARSERYYIKQAEIETNITVKFMLDGSRSMSYAENDISKLQYAKVVAAALAYLARKQSDTFGLYMVNDQAITAVQPRFEQQQFMRFLHALIEMESAGSWRQSGDLEVLFDHHGKELIIFFSDLYDENGDLQKFVSRLKTPRNEVIVFHLMGERELDLSYNGTYTFQELESGRSIKVDTVLQQKQYTERVQQWIRDTRTWMLEKQIHYYLVGMDATFEHVLRDFLRVRKSLAR